MNTNIVYVVSNDAIDNKNAVVAFSNDGQGNMSLIDGSPFYTHGKGYKSPFDLPHIGPMDVDQNIIFNQDKSLLYGTNGGSDSIFVMSIDSNGSLAHIDGSPFASQGLNPVSLGLAGDKMIVINKNEDPARNMADTLPNYVTFDITKTGALTPIPGAKLELPTAGRSPTQALVVDDKFLYDGDIGRFPQPQRTAMFGQQLLMDGVSVMRAFVINDDGTLDPHTPLTPPDKYFEGSLDIDGDGVVDPLMFGLAKHPNGPYIYIGYVTAAKLAVYKYDDEGKLGLVNVVENKGQLICWIKFNNEGTRAYTTNTGDGTLSVYDTSDPENPEEIQTVKLAGEGNPFQLDIDSANNFIYVLKIRSFPEVPEGSANHLNVLKVEQDGTVSEVANSPVGIPHLDESGSPQGVVAL